jgi:anti-anti-sigma factor
MNNLQQNSSTQLVSGIRELIKGQVQEFLQELRPIVREQSVRLDLSRVERIDAAGLAALVSVYCDARKASHDFAVVNPPRHVARILAIVGLDRILVSKEGGEAMLPRPQPGSRMNEIAA